MARLHHLALRTHDLERLLAFYREWFGFELVRDARPRSVWLMLEPSSIFMLERAEQDEPPLAAGSRELQAFAVSADERAHLRERLLGAGLLEAETEHTLYFRDPDGRRVAVSSHPLR
jgi:catechol 2,3-dioxygenase-like lactoylglutathione lyase family enzyme